MGYFKRPQILTLVIAIAAVVLLLLLPRTTDVVPVEESTEQAAPSGNFAEDAVNALGVADRLDHDEIVARVEKAGDPLAKIEILDSLANFWDKRGNQLMAAEQLEKIALIINDKPSRFIAGDKYFEAFSTMDDERKRIALEKAMANYQAVLDENPEDLEAMTSLAVCYVEGAAVTGEAPMKGIGMLRQVLEIDPENINAMVNLGYFATKSGQFDKAIERFERVLEIDPEFSDAYLYLSETYLQKGDNEKAASYLEEYRRFLKDPFQQQQLDTYIEKIRTNNI